MIKITSATPSIHTDGMYLDVSIYKNWASVKTGVSISSPLFYSNYSQIHLSVDMLDISPWLDFAECPARGAYIPTGTTITAPITITAWYLDTSSTSTTITTTSTINVTVPKYILFYEDKKPEDPIVPDPIVPPPPPPPPPPAAPAAPKNIKMKRNNTTITGTWEGYASYYNVYYIFEGKEVVIKKTHREKTISFQMPDKMKLGGTITLKVTPVGEGGTGQSGTAELEKIYQKPAKQNKKNIEYDGHTLYIEWDKEINQQEFDEFASLKNYVCYVDGQKYITTEKNLEIPNFIKEPMDRINISVDVIDTNDFRTPGDLFNYSYNGFLIDIYDNNWKKSDIFIYDESTGSWKYTISGFIFENGEWKNINVNEVKTQSIESTEQEPIIIENDINMLYCKLHNRNSYHCHYDCKIYSCPRWLITNYCQVLRDIYNHNNIYTPWSKIYPVNEQELRTLYDYYNKLWHEQNNTNNGGL